MASEAKPRYTRDGSAEVEARIAADQALIGAEVLRALPPPRLQALVLGGGYGRAEGGYRIVGGEPRACNDYDYFVVVDGSRAEARAASRVLGDLGPALHSRVGVEVDFAVVRASRLPRLEFSLMNAELKWGHRVIVGDPCALGVMAEMPLDRVPLSEFARLMLNRGSLLLMNRQVLASGGPIGDEAREQFARYIDKAVLACGDVRLALAGRYHLKYDVRRRRLDRLAWPGSAAFLRRYDSALEARFGPDPVLVPDGQEHAALEAAVADWLEALGELETARLGRLPPWSEYALPGVSKGQSRGGWEAVVRNLAVTARDFGFRELGRNLRWSCRYPRERLLSVLPGLLTPSSGVRQPDISTALSAGAECSELELAERFLSMWGRYG